MVWEVESGDALHLPCLASPWGAPPHADLRGSELLIQRAPHLACHLSSGGMTSESGPYYFIYL